MTSDEIQYLSSSIRDLRKELTRLSLLVEKQNKAFTTWRKFQLKTDRQRQKNFQKTMNLVYDGLRTVIRGQYALADALSDVDIRAEKNVAKDVIFSKLQKKK